MHVSRLGCHPLYLLAILAPACIAGSSDDDADDGGTVDTSGCFGDCEDTGNVPSTGCPAKDGANGSGTMWSSIDSFVENRTMSAAGSPHFVSGALLFYDVDLEIEPCALVLFDAAAGVDVVGTGRIVARGTVDSPIVMDAIDPAAPWAGLSTGGFVGVYGGFVDLAHVELRNAGGYADYPAALYLGDDELADVVGEVARVQDVTIDGSHSHGVMLFDGAAFTADSANLVIRGAAAAPIRSDLLLASSIPPGDYDDNLVAYIELDDGAFTQPPLLVMHDRGLPYRLGDDDPLSGFSINWASADNGSSSTLLLEPGVELRFAPDQSLTMYEGGVLDARGTAEAPIVLTSAAPSPAAGDWIGVIFDGPAASDTRLDHLEVGYAGADVLVPTWSHCTATDIEDTTEAAALTLTSPPPAGMLGSASIHHSSAHGINRAWAGDDVDLAATVTFEAIAGCPQTVPRSGDESCPATVTCAG